MRRLVERIGLGLVAITAAALLASPAAAAPEGARHDADRHVTVAGVQVAVDSTGRLRQPTPEEARQLAAGLRAMFSPAPLATPADGQARLSKSASGTLSYILGGDSLNVSLARVEADGSVSQACVGTYDAAIGFLLGAPALEEK